MAIQVYNTLSRQKEPFVPLHGNRVSMFVCGLTVYDLPHIGHAKTYAVFDVIAKYLRYRGYSVFYLQNVTDIDDKIINRATERNTTPKELAEKYFAEYLRDIRRLGIDGVSFYAKATEYIPEIIAQIQTLIEKGYAYEADGSVYYEVNKFHEFGKLSRQKLDSLEAGARVDINESKRNPEDFVLWKACKPGEPFWDSPWGKGRPGWHIEDTAITVTQFGPQYDLHGGATELIFPHHESEIAQAEAATGAKPFVKYWLHTGLLNIRGEKMSKSLGNFFTIREILEKYPADVLRFFLINTHYRSPIDFYDSLLDEAKSSLGRLKNAVDELRFALQKAGDDSGDAAADAALLKAAAAARERFVAHMDDDFNTREAIASLFELVSAANDAIAAKKPLGRAAVSSALGALTELGGLLGILGADESEAHARREKELLAIITEVREDARRRKDYATADAIRDRLKKAGISLEDSAQGMKVKKGA